MIALVVVASLLIGVSLGVLGGGGSILTVPVLIYLAGTQAKEAIATSLFVVGVTSAAGVVSHARAGRVRWRTGLLFGMAGMVGAYAGGRLAAFIPGTVLLISFALMMIATAVAMIRGRRGEPKRAHRELPVPHVLLDGIVVGLVTGLVGAGGGFLVVPALALLGGLPMTVAVGTSLLVIAMKSFAGLAGHLAGVDIDWGFAALVTATAVVGGLIGGRLAGRVPQDALRKSFGWFLAAMGAFVLAQQAGPGLRHAVLTSRWTWAAGAMAAGVLLGRSRLLDRPGSPMTPAALVPSHGNNPDTTDACLDSPEGARRKGAPAGGAETEGMSPKEGVRPMTTAGEDRSRTLGDAALTTTCGRRIAVKCLRLAPVDRPISRVTLDVGRDRSGEPGAWAALTADEARTLARHLLTHAALAEQRPGHPG